MPAPRGKSPSGASVSKVNQTAESGSAQNPIQAGDSVFSRKSAQLGEQKDTQRPSEASELNIPSPQTKNRPSHREIELIAYEIYLQRGGIEGSALEDWLQAERRLLEAFESDSETSEKARAQGA